MCVCMLWFVQMSVSVTPDVWTDLLVTGLSFYTLSVPITAAHAADRGF